MSDRLAQAGADYVTRIVRAPSEVDAAAWDALLRAHTARTAAPGGSVFMQHAYLAALHDTGCASPATGWTPHWVTLWRADELTAAAPLYLKTHSRGEYVFDWGWAQAYARHGFAYYPKGLVAVPFTPVPGPRLLACDDDAARALLHELRATAQALNLSSLHILFADAADQRTAAAGGMMARHTVQFHWHNRHPVSGQPFADFDDFLSSLSQDKRKKIRQERRKVRDAGIRFRTLRGDAAGDMEWDFFVRCYQQTYLEHGNPPYLTDAFFQRVRQTQAGHWLLCVADTADGAPVGASLVALSDAGPSPQAAFGRYWGALARVDCLHFEACYYQPLQWCIAHGVARFEGGAQGEHKMARALLPTDTVSLHWLAHPAFAQAVDRFLHEEGAAVQDYLAWQTTRSPFKRSP